MYWVYGNHQHPDGEVMVKRFEATPRYSPHNDLWATLFKAHLVIELQHTAAENAAISAEPDVAVRKTLRQTYINAKVNQLIDVYSQDYQNCGLYLDDDTKTRHSLTNGNSISGTRVLYRSWDKDGGDEFATVRSAYVIVGALYETAYTQIYNYQEDLDFIGTGGRDFEMVQNQTGLPTDQIIFEKTSQTVIQYGSIVGLSTWIIGNIPPPLFPVREHGRRRVENWESPKWQGNAHKLFGNRWRYVMEFPVGQDQPTMAATLPVNFSTTTHAFPPIFTSF